MTDKRIIRTAPVELHLAPDQVVLYDGLEDWIDTTGTFDHTQPGVLFASEMLPTFMEVEGEQVKVSDETVLIAVHPSVWARQHFAGWEARGKVPEE